VREHRIGALVGFGAVAEHAHLPAYRRDPRFELRAVVEPDAHRRELARERLGPRVRLFPDLGSLLADGRPDFLDVSAPPAAHAAAIERAAEAGVHVLVEKPLARSLAEAQRALEATRRASSVLVTVHNWHHAPAFRALRSAVAAGAVGVPREVCFVTERSQPAGGAASWRLDAKTAGGGILVDHGWHQLYLARALLGDADPLGVSARVERRRWLAASVEDTATCRVRFAGDLRAELQLSWAAQRRRTEVLLRGSAGELRLVDGSLTLLARGREEPWPVEPDSPDDSWHAAWFPGVLDVFAEALERPERAEASRIEAELCQRLIDAAYRSSAQAGREVAL
jgi:predicted dehydrogenase